MTYFWIRQSTNKWFTQFCSYPFWMTNAIQYQNCTLQSRRSNRTEISIKWTFDAVIWSVTKPATASKTNIICRWFIKFPTTFVAKWNVRRTCSNPQTPNTHTHTQSLFTLMHARKLLADWQKLVPNTTKFDPKISFPSLSLYVSFSLCVSCCFSLSIFINSMMHRISSSIVNIVNAERQARVRAHLLSTIYVCIRSMLCIRTKSPKAQSL